jgi:putative ABC transport system substrate-binding protein
MFSLNILKKLFDQIIKISVLAACLTACTQETTSKKIGIIVPIEHQAMNDIVSGFKEALHKSHPNIFFKVANAQGDINLKRAIIQQMKNEHYDVIVPIGTDSSQMTLSMIHDQPIVSLASNITEDERSSLKKCNVAVVHDEISAEQYIQFIHTVYPKIKKISLIHSPSEKIYPEVEKTINVAKKFDMHIVPMMAQTLNDLSIIAKNIPKDAEAIFILKDSVIVSGITTLQKTAEKRHIPLISSDQGSVQNGATVALGVHEREIGEQGGLLAAQILQNKSACQLPIINLTALTIFTNQNSLRLSGLSINPIKNAGLALNYQLETM